MLRRDGFPLHQAPITLLKAPRRSSTVASGTRALLLHVEDMEVSIINGTNIPNRGMHRLTVIAAVSPVAEATIGEVVIGAEVEEATKVEEGVTDMEDID